MIVSNIELFEIRRRGKALKNMRRAQQILSQSVAQCIKRPVTWQKITENLEGIILKVRARSQVV